MTGTGNVELRIAALKGLIAGGDLRSVGGRLGVSADEVRELVVRSGWPHKEPMTRALAVLERNARSEVEGLLERGERSELFGTRKLCERIRGLCDDLREALEREEETRELREEIRALEGRLAEKRKELGDGRRTVSRSKRREKRVTELNREIKEWARGQGLKVSAQGRVPNEVRAAWEARET